MRAILGILFWAAFLGFLILRDPNGGLANFVYNSGRAVTTTATLFFEGVRDGR